MVNIQRTARSRFLAHYMGMYHQKESAWADFAKSHSEVARLAEFDQGTATSRDRDISALIEEICPVWKFVPNTDPEDKYKDLLRLVNKGYYPSDGERKKLLEMRRDSAIMATKKANDGYVLHRWINAMILDNLARDENCPLQKASVDFGEKIGSIDELFDTFEIADKMCNPNVRRPAYSAERLSNFNLEGYARRRLAFVGKKALANAMVSVSPKLLDGDRDRLLKVKVDLVYIKEGMDIVEWAKKYKTLAPYK